MILSPITSPKNPEVVLIYNAYTKAFPENERRSKEQFDALFGNPESGIYTINVNDNIIGYIVLWNLDEFVFLEHFEIFESYRNFKYGSKVLAQLKAQYPKIILEAEPSNLDEMAARRIKFYQRNGYTIIDKNYIQPSYGPGKSELNLFLLATWTPNDSISCINTIKTVVYAS